jgi:hypothetical protein
LSAGVVRIELCTIEWPATERNPITRFEIDRVEWAASALPDRSRATETAHAGLVQWKTEIARKLAFCQGLCAAVVPNSSALDQANPESLARKLPRHCAASCTSANDADIGFDGRPTRYTARV